jgi:hypothetical protein
MARYRETPDVEREREYSAVPHERFGNERAWSVTGGTLALGQIVHLHAMCGKAAAIKKAIAQDKIEQAVRRLTTPAPADFCAAQNPRFNKSRWLGYIAGTNGPSGGRV